VIYDPELSLGLPVGLSITSGYQRYRTRRRRPAVRVDANPVISPWRKYRGVGSRLPVIKANPSDVTARSDALYGAWLCGSVFRRAVALHPQALLSLAAVQPPHAETFHTTFLPHALVS
jgi:alcohol dehydrogenase class IV